MTDNELANLLDELIAKYNRETRHLEFKSNYQDANALLLNLLRRKFLSSLTSQARVRISTLKWV